MADMQMPGYLDFGRAMEMNPQAYRQFQAQMNLANQFQQQKAQQDKMMQAEQLKAAQLANLFNEKQNPQKLEAQSLDNVNQGYTNRLNAVRASQEEELSPMKMDSAKRKMILEADESEIQKLQLAGQKLLYSENPEDQKKGRMVLEKSKEFIQMRAKHADEMEKVKLQRDSAERIASGNNATTLAAARMAQDGANARAAATRESKIKSPQEIAAKLGYEKGATYYRIQAENADSQEERDQLLKLADEFYKANMQQKNAQAGNKADLNQLGIPTNPVSSPFAGGKPQLPAGWSMK